MNRVEMQDTWLIVPDTTTIQHTFMPFMPTW
jgi:hypothetical protein